MDGMMASVQRNSNRSSTITVNCTLKTNGIGKTVYRVVHNRNTFVWELGNGCTYIYNNNNNNDSIKYYYDNKLYKSELSDVTLNTPKVQRYKIIICAIQAYIITYVIEISIFRNTRFCRSILVSVEL